MRSLNYEIEVSGEDEEQNCVGSFEGYVVNKSEENWRFYLEREITSNDVLNFLLKRIEESAVEKIAVLKSINVDEEFRGSGFGAELMDNFLEQASDHGADLYMLVADDMEIQKKGFSLNKWYEDYGFEIVKPQSDTTFMVWDIQRKLELNNKSLEKQLAEHLDVSAKGLKI